MSPRPRHDLPPGALLTRILLFASLLWIVSEGRPGHPVGALLVVIAAAATSLALIPARSFRISARGLIRFAPYFLLESVRGGVDVAARALRPVQQLTPGFVEYTLQLRAPAARTFFASAVSLLPGTLSVHLGPEQLRVHALDRTRGPESRLRSLEDRVSDLFGEPRRNEGA